MMSSGSESSHSISDRLSSLASVSLSSISDSALMTEIRTSARISVSTSMCISSGKLRHKRTRCSTGNASKIRAIEPSSKPFSTISPSRWVCSDSSAVAINSIC
ncbi:Uncharacterised protein [Vibrio cholerae]|nr:Uncharacterised protein [Vibrio cholerae]